MNFHCPKLKMKCIPKQMRIWILFVILFNFFLYIVHHHFTEEEKRQFYMKHYLSFKQQYKLNDSVCNLPLDKGPMDPSISRLIETKPSRVECPKSDSKPITYVDENGVLRQNSTDYRCTYQFLSKYYELDHKIKYSPRQNLIRQKGVKLVDQENYVLVQCTAEKSGGEFYENLHYWFNSDALKRSRLLNEDKNQNTENEYSVLIVVIESLSRLNYLRFMKKTRSFLEQQLDNGKTFYMEGLTKLADNSFPNMVPLLTGKLAYHNELPGSCDGPFDDWPFVWKSYAKKGYATSIIEDDVDFTLFNYLAKGFQKGPPTDFYPRPFWMHLFQQYNTFRKKWLPFSLSHCHLDRVPKVDIFFDQTHHFIRRCNENGVPFFGFHFFIELTHEDFNNVQMIDEHVFEFLQRSSNILNNGKTIFILMGDHGNRYGPILQTTIGKIEERMPLFSIHLPNKLLAKHQHLEKYLKLNRQRLTTWLDVHHILDDIHRENFMEMAKKDDHHDSGLEKDGAAERSSNNIRPSMKRSYSLWREEVPEARRCEDAHIPELYCTCNSRVPISNETESARAASQALLDVINLELLPYMRMCKKLKLSRIISAEVILLSSPLVNYQNFRKLMEITIVTEPSEAVFRSQLYLTAHSRRWMVENGQITRINRYGDESWCVRDRRIKPLCYCHKQWSF